MTRGAGHNARRSSIRQVSHLKGAVIPSTIVGELWVGIAALLCRYYIGLAVVLATITATS